jgi:phosphoserine phosphatase
MVVAGLAVFDLDGTLIECETLVVLGEIVGRQAEMERITEEAMQGRLEFGIALKKRLALLKGLDVAAVKKIACELKLREGAEELVRYLKSEGYKTAIITGGFTLVAEIIAERLGIDEVVANRLETEKRKLTGGCIPNVNNNKDVLLRELINKYKPELTVAVGDGANDVPMLLAADVGVGLGAREAVRKHADYNIKNLWELHRLLEGRRRG